MPNFRFEAMGSTGEAQTDQIQAANAEEAMSMLRTSGLFVTALTEVTQGADNGTSFESMAAQPKSVASTGDGAVTRQPRHGRRLGIVVTAVGLICAACGLYGVIDSLLFGMGAEYVHATSVRTVQVGGDSFPLLEFVASGNQYGVVPRGAYGILTDSVRTHELLYRPTRPEDARLAHWESRFAIPLILLVLGGLFTPGALLLLRNGNVPRFLKVIYIGFFVAAGVTGALFAILPIFRR